MTPPAPAAPLAGIRVVDLSGPEGELAGRTLAELGADVLKVEPPGGVATRSRPPFDDRNGESLVWAAAGIGKASTVLDLDNAADRDRLTQLIAAADVLIESFPPDTFDAADLAGGNARLVHASITPYGSTGPKAQWPGTELTAEAACGRLINQGDRDRPPVPIGYPQAYFHAGVQAAADIVIALVERDRSGLGQHLDVSIQAVMVHTLFGTVSGTLLDEDPDRDRSEEAAAAAKRRATRLDLLPEVWECADGFVAAPLAAGALPLADYVMKEVAAAEPGVLDPDVAAINWPRLAADVLRSRIDDDVVRRAIDVLAGWFRSHTKAELYELAHHGDFRMGPLLTTADLVADDHLRQRRFWTDIGGRVHPGPAVRPLLPSEPPPPAPALGDDRALLRAWAEPRRGDQPAARPTGERTGDAFAGLKVADFSWVAVGPTIGRALADQGATVVRVESSRRLDVARTLAPFRNNSKQPNDSHWYAHFNASKLGLSLDLGSESGREVARRLVGWADVVLESFSPGTMARLGLDYQTLSADHPELIMMSASLLGQTGPMAQFAGFGQQGVGLCGISTITGWPDRKPVPPLGAYTDVIAPKYGIAALAAAVYQRDRTGHGVHLDLGQVEASIRFIEPLILDQTVNGRTAGLRGMASDTASPHGIYPVTGEHRFIAIAIETDLQWQAFRHVAQFGDDVGRHAADDAITCWTSGKDGRELEEQLCQAGVPAAIVARPREVAADPQLWHRDFFVTWPHASMGPSPYEAQPTQFSARSDQPGVHGPAPCLGQHTDHVLADLLGYDESEIAALRETGALQ